MLKTLLKTADPEDEEVRAPLNTRVPREVRILNATLDEDPASPSAVVVHGRLDPNTLRFLNVDNSYQRPLGDRQDIFDALKAGVVVPSIEAGVRGQDFTWDGDACIIKDPVYIIDGWQRVGTALKVLDDNPNHPLRLFVSAHFGTDPVWERHRFTDLNKNIRKVSVNLHLRNSRDTSEAISTLYGLSTNERKFALYGRVSWSQNMKRGELLGARQMAYTAASLHRHHAGAPAGTSQSIQDALAKAAKSVGLPNFRHNVTAFFALLDECWGLQSIEYRTQATHLKPMFLVQLARLLSTHVDFWDANGCKLFVAADQRRKLAKFPINDPHVRALAGGNGSAANILYDLMIQHMNSGRRTGQLRSRHSR